MKDAFAGYYRLSETELRALWQDCLFVLDANVLLNFHRYSREARDDLLRVLRRVSDRLWIPHQVALEYQENRPTVIAEQVEKYDKVSGVLRKVRNSLGGELDKLQLEKRHALIDPSDLLRRVDEIFDQFEKDLRDLKQKQPNVFDEDKVRDHLDFLFKGKVGPPPTSQEWLDHLYSEGEVRYEQKRPPGYMDIGKAQNEDSDTHLFGDLVVRSEYGDLIIWKQILEEARTREQLKHLVFITDDEKEDWWWIVRSGGAKRLGPRPELAQEMLTEAGISRFYMYNSERFLSFAERFLNIPIKKESVDQVRDVAEVSERDRQRRVPSRMTEMREFAFSAERAVLDWLESTNPSRKIIANRHGFPDYVVVEETGAREGYEVSPIRSPQMGLLRLRDVAYRGYYEVGEGDLDALSIVLVLMNKDDMQEASRRIEKFKVPAKVSILLGYLQPKDGGQEELQHQFVFHSYYGSSER